MPVWRLKSALFYTVGATDRLLGHMAVYSTAEGPCAANVAINPPSTHSGRVALSAAYNLDRAINMHLSSPGRNCYPSPLKPRSSPRDTNRLPLTLLLRLPGVVVYANQLCRLRLVCPTVEYLKHAPLIRWTISSRGQLRGAFAGGTFCA